jgi:methenyltetrahydromethanopterin cyclohydrolase
VLYSVNESALEIVSDILDSREDLRCRIAEQSNGCMVIDAGVETQGSTELGRLIAEVSMGGLAAVRMSRMTIGDLDLPAVIVGTDQPVIATLGSQYSGWTIRVGKFSAMGSGPARALARVERSLYEEIGYEDKHSSGVVILETRSMPTAEVTQYIADKCEISPSDLTCIVVPTASEAGSAQISARVVEVGVHKMRALGLDLSNIRRGYGVAPIAPVMKNDNRAMGATNDCILYGGRTFFFLRENDAGFGKRVEEIPSCCSGQHGQPFYELFESVGFDFYKVDPLLFSPAEVTISHVESRTVYKAGSLNPQILKKSLGI